MHERSKSQIRRLSVQIENDGIENGWVITCPQCQAKISHFSLADEWFCMCGQQGILEYPEEEDDDSEIEPA